MLCIGNKSYILSDETFKKNKVKRDRKCWCNKELSLVRTSQLKAQLFTSNCWNNLWRVERDDEKTNQNKASTTVGWMSYPIAEVFEWSLPIVDYHSLWGVKWILIGWVSPVHQPALVVLQNEVGESVDVSGGHRPTAHPIRHVPNL